jgi:acetyl/propionyl-CoA carboxylase alpha subunit
MNLSDEKTIRIEIAGKIHEFDIADVRDLDSVATGERTWHLLDNGTSHTISVIAVDRENRTARFRIDGEYREARLVTPLDALIERLGMNKALARKVSALHAPMPGLVKGIMVNAGDAVEKGAPLLILEAMKMENVMTAPDAVRIKRVDVSLAQAVDKGARLIEFDVD